MRTFICVALLATLACSVAVAACSSGGTGSTSTGADTTGTSGSAGSGGSTANPASIARGQYLVDHLLACGECHTPVDANGKPDKTKYLAGSRSYDFKTMNGDIVSVYAENLT